MSLLSHASRPLTRRTHLRWLSSSTPRVILSGIQPTGVPHLGNYLGALKEWVRIQDESPQDDTFIWMIADLHAMTIHQDPRKLRICRNETLAMLLAIGLDPKQSIIFHQSDVPAHSELMWILSCQASTGSLGRMTQWKDKTASIKTGSEKLKLGLFSYPVLQAADVLVHGTTHVPVGHDQAQHLEFTRQMANRFNESYEGDILIQPETMIGSAKRVMSLTEPKSKMSKSAASGKSRILLSDSEEVIAEKINAALTDSMEGVSYDPEQRPGVSNLIEIIHHTAEDSPDWSLEDLCKDLEGLSLKALKERAVEVVCTALAPIRERYQSTIEDLTELEAVAADGAAKAAANADVVLSRVKEAVGLR
ncbi:tryptophanyl-tRNA synthetase [Piedraia hortae CBS 480.64]|uniref:Tryptophan--tRNA ligase, mitochondrial n=1 Tax=Piedraia hortae CBS 480.64 TaxID=1314780 RepID=A0A6A7C2Y3_9PEZI|nr:tryptophanyl-tRNA synthetase [Piedraia hortae CBS 480.64]